MQVVDAKDEHSFAFDLLDCTKLIPEELVPVKYVGTIELNRNPADFFSETEVRRAALTALTRQNVAFCTGNVRSSQRRRCTDASIRSFAASITATIRCCPPAISAVRRVLSTVAHSADLDTQLSRLGHINHGQLPIKRSAKGCPVISTLRDGAGQHLNTVGPNVRATKSRSSLIAAVLPQ